MKLTPHQVDALSYLASIPPGYKADVCVKAVGLRTARALEEMGLIKLHVEEGTYRVGYGLFGKQGKSAVRKTYSDFTATLTPEGRAAAATRRNPSINDPNLTVETLKLRRLGPGYYEHVNKATGTKWWIIHRYGEFRGEDHWVYMRTDDNAGDWESRIHDHYATKRDTVEALVEGLRERQAPYNPYGR
jgi:hypothetical protein